MSKGDWMRSSTSRYGNCCNAVPKRWTWRTLLYDFLEQPEEEAPGVGADVQRAEQVRETFHGDSRSTTTLLVMAASLLVAAVTGYIAVQQQRAVSGLQNEVALATAKMRIGQFSDALLPESNVVTALRSTRSPARA
jgi:hypothetical protein